jgi:RNA polymerase sigma factor (sigma-70 family)
MRTEPTDRELMARLRSDPAAFELFYRRHFDRVVGYAARRLRNPADVADLVAATFVTALTAAEAYEPARGEPTAWLLGIASRLLAGTARQSRRDAALIARIAERRTLAPDDLERLEDRIAAEQSTVAVLAAMDELKPRAREALMLVGVDRLTPSDAAAVLGISGSNFRMRLSAARRALKRSLDSGPPDRHTDLQAVTNPTSQR